MDLLDSNEIFLLNELVDRNFASKYKGSVLGIFWSVLKPLGIMLIFTIVFSTIFHGRVENYPVYILSGKCIYDFFTSAVGASMKSLDSNRNILEKTPAPKRMFVLGSILAEFLNFIITLILLVGVMIVTRAQFHFTTIPLSILPIMSVILFVTGLGFMLSIFSVYYRDIQHLWSVLTQIIFYSSAIFYPMDIVPEPFHKYMILNPIFWIVDQFRDFFVYGIIPNIIYVLNLILFSLIIFILGIIIFRKYEKKVILKF